MPFPVYHVFDFFHRETSVLISFFYLQSSCSFKAKRKSLLREQLFPLNILHKTENDSKVYYVEARLCSLIK